MRGHSPWQFGLLTDLGSGDGVYCCTGWCVARMGSGSYRGLLERFVGPMSARIHSKYRVVDAA